MLPTCHQNQILQISLFLNARGREQCNNGVLNYNVLRYITVIQTCQSPVLLVFLVLLVHGKFDSLKCRADRHG